MDPHQPVPPLPVFLPRGTLAPRGAFPRRQEADQVRATTSIPAALTPAWRDEQRFGRARERSEPLLRFVRTGGVVLRCSHGASRSGERAWSNARWAERGGPGLAAPARMGDARWMGALFASVIGEVWGSLGERRFLFLTLIGFVCAFGFVRLSTRLMRSPRVPWWPGSVVSEGGVHVHHLFFGIVLMMVAGGLSFAAGETDGPWYAIYAVLFGIGIGLAIDEYALVAPPRRRLLVPRGPQLDRRHADRPGLDRLRTARVRARADRRRFARGAGDHRGGGDAAFRLGADRRRQIPARARSVRHLRPRARRLRRAAARQAALGLGPSASTGSAARPSRRGPSSGSGPTAQPIATRSACATRSVGSRRRSTRRGSKRPRRRQRQRQPRLRRSDRLHRDDSGWTTRPLTSRSTPRSTAPAGASPPLSL
jgi:hypothetical protein